MLTTPETSVGGILGMYLILIGEKGTVFQAESTTEKLMWVACRGSACNWGGGRQVHDLLMTKNDDRQKISQRVRSPLNSGLR